MKYEDLKCEVCDGAGEISRDTGGGDGDSPRAVEYTCDECKGTGIDQAQLRALLLDPEPQRPVESPGSRLDKLNEEYGFNPQDCIVDGKLTLHPVYKKWLPACWLIEEIYGLQLVEEISLGKARELTAAVIEKHLPK